MAGRIHLDVRALEGPDGCDLVVEALDLLRPCESLDLTLDHPPGCVHEAARAGVAADTLHLKAVGSGDGTWRVRVRRIR